MQGAKLIKRLVKLCASSHMLNTGELGKPDHPAGVSDTCEPCNSLYITTAVTPQNW